MLKISSTFDSGAIEVVRLDDPADIRLRLRKDNAADFHQWFHFRLMGAAGKPVRMVFENAAGAAYPDGWRDYRCVASYDRQNWFRIAGTRYEDGQLIVEHTPERDSLYYAYFEPYSHERHLDLLARVELSPYARVRNLGSTVDGRDLDVVTVGRDAPGRVPVWIIARQHPGETMAEWFVEGLLERLLDNADPVARKVREHAVLHIVPNMNPDGAVRGNLRTNAAGRNLNREWREPDPAASPEVFLVRAEMERSGCALFLDIHGDESLPYVFFSTAEDGARLHRRGGGRAGALRRDPPHGEPRLPDAGGLQARPLRRGTADAGEQVGRQPVRLRVADPGDAVQGQHHPARRPRRLERCAQQAPGRGHARSDPAPPA